MEKNYFLIKDKQRDKFIFWWNLTKKMGVLVGGNLPQKYILGNCMLFDSWIISRIYLFIWHFCWPNYMPQHRFNKEVAAKWNPILECHLKKKKINSKKLKFTYLLWNLNKNNKKSSVIKLSLFVITILENK